MLLDLEQNRQKGELCHFRDICLSVQAPWLKGLIFLQGRFSDTWLSRASTLAPCHCFRNLHLFCTILVKYLLCMFVSFSVPFLILLYTASGEWMEVFIYRDSSSLPCVVTANSVQALYRARRFLSVCAASHLLTLNFISHSVSCTQLVLNAIS